MITTNAAWDAKNAAMAKRPIYVLSITGVTSVFATADLARAGVTGTLPDVKPWLKTPQGAPQTIDVVNGTSSIGELQCEVIDQGGFVRGLVGTNSLCGSTATLLAGYPGIAWAEFVPVQTYVLYKVTPTAGYTSWLFVCRDRQSLAKKTVYIHPENGELLSTDNPWYLSGTPAEIFQAIALFALGLAGSDIDLAQMALLDDPAEGLFAAARPFLFALTESFEAKQFLETEILKPSALYPVVTNTGQYSLRSGRAPATGPAAVFTFDEANTTVLPVIDRMPVINEALWAYDDDGQGTAGTRATYLEATSISAFGRGQQWSVQSKGLRSELGAGWFAQAVSSRLFRRFAGTPTGLLGGAPTLAMEAFLMTLPVWVGDTVGVTHSKMPDVTTGALGVTDRLYEVIERTPDYAGGKMRYKLLDTGLTGIAPARTWGAASARPGVIGTDKWF